MPPGRPGACSSPATTSPNGCGRKRRARSCAQEQVRLREAEEANRAKDDFLATLSHELRTPLNAALGWTHILRDSLHADHRHGAVVQAIYRNLQLQSRIVSDILDIARITKGELPLEEERVDMRAVFEAAVDMVREAANARSVTVDIHCVGSADVRGDSRRLQQVAWNLLSNAVKFTPRARGGDGVDSRGRRPRRMLGRGRRARASRRPSCHTSSNSSVRQILRRRASMAGWDWDWPSRTRSWPCTAARSVPAIVPPAALSSSSVCRRAMRLRSQRERRHARSLTSGSFRARRQSECCLGQWAGGLPAHQTRLYRPSLLPARLSSSAFRRSLCHSKYPWISDHGRALRLHRFNVASSWGPS